MVSRSLLWTSPTGRGNHAPAGTVFAGYAIERVLGRGGMGVMYQASQPRLQRSIAFEVDGDSLVSTGGPAWTSIRPGGWLGSR